MEDNSLTLKLISLLVIVSLVAILVAIYHYVTVCWWNCQRNPIPPHQVRQQNQQQTEDYSLENSVVLLIPAHKHQKRIRLGSKGGEVDDDAICSICLCEFEENEELRTLPECLHSFHVTCIDMWLYSHSTCPVCRSIAIPSSQILFQILDSDSDIEIRQEASNVV